MSPNCPAPAACSAVKAPTPPSPVTAAPRALIVPSFHVTQTLPAPALTEGWSIEPVSIVCRSVKFAPPSVLRYRVTALTAALMFTRNRLPNKSHAAAATLSQHEAPIPAPAATQVAPPSVLRRAVAPGLDAKKSCWVLVGLMAIVP